jgi:hypothetical protein
MYNVPTGIAAYCSVLFAKLAYPHDSSWLYTKQSVVKDLVERKDVQEGLQAYSQQLVDVAFHSGLLHRCNYGLQGNTVAGFLSPCLGTRLASLLQTRVILHKKLIERNQVVDSYGEEAAKVAVCTDTNDPQPNLDTKPPAPRKKKKKKGGGDGEFIYSTAKQKALRDKVFSDGFVKDFDEMTKTYRELLAHQSDRNLPRTNFSKGITSDAKMRAHKESGLLLLLLMILCVTKTSYYIVEVRKLTEPRAAAFIRLLESLLIMEQWMKQDIFEVKSLPAIKRHLRRVMQLFSSVVDPQEGNGDCTENFFLPMHLIDNVKKYGAPATWEKGKWGAQPCIKCKGARRAHSTPTR